MDPIHFQKTINLFPQLSEAQAVCCFLFATSASYSEISEIRGNSPVSVKKTLEKAQQKLGLHSVQSIRPVFLTRIMFSTFYRLRTGKERSECLKTDVRNLLQHFHTAKDPIRLFPELDIEKALIMYMHCSGESIQDICEAFFCTEADIYLEIENLLEILEINSLQTLRIVVLARLEAFLVSLSFKSN
jgi:hypothetical protein